MPSKSHKNADLYGNISIQNIRNSGSKESRLRKVKNEISIQPKVLLTTCITFMIHFILQIIRCSILLKRQTEKKKPDCSHENDMPADSSSLIDCIRAINDQFFLPAKIRKIAAVNDDMSICM